MTAAQATCGSVTKAQMVANLANNGALTASNLLYGVLTGSISLQTAATIAATAATTAFKAALTALTGPIGLVVAGVGLAVGALVGLWQWLTADSEETKRLKSEQEELVKSTDQLTDSVKQSAKERQKNLESVKGNTESYQKLADEIVQLSQKTNKTAADKKNLKKKIDALNASVSGLNLVYDKNTDSLSHNNDQIKARISAMEAESTWETSQKNLLDIEQKRAEIGEQLKKIAEQRKKWNEESNVSDSVRKERLQELNDKETELKILRQNCKLSTKKRLKFNRRHLKRWLLLPKMDLIDKLYHTKVCLKLNKKRLMICALNTMSCLKPQRTCLIRYK